MEVITKSNKKSKGLNKRKLLKDLKNHCSTTLDVKLESVNLKSKTMKYLTLFIVTLLLPLFSLAQHPRTVLISNKVKIVDIKTGEDVTDWDFQTNKIILERGTVSIIGKEGTKKYIVDPIKTGKDYIICNAYDSKGDSTVLGIKGMGTQHSLLTIIIAGTKAHSYYMTVVSTSK